MQILLAGINHRSAPLATREAMSLSKAALPQALGTLKSLMTRGVLLSTCNRTEVYTVAADGDEGFREVNTYLQGQFGMAQDDLQPYLYTLEQDDAVAHLFRVASGLDSLIIGESEILGQVRDAYSMASNHGTAGGVLARLFHEALRVGKRARTETAIGRNALSISRACVEMARRSLGDLRSKRAVVVGVGDAGRLAARALKDAGLNSLVVANRTRSHAEELAEALDAELAELDDLPHLLGEVDIVISSTGAPDFLLSEEMVGEAMAQRPDQPLFIVDIAVPRDVDPAAGQIPYVHLFTMYDLEMLAEANRKDRETEALQVEHIVGEEVTRFQEWLEHQLLTPTIAAIRHQAEALRATEVHRLKGLSEADSERVNAMTKAMVKKLLHTPTHALRQRKDESFTQAARELFGLDTQ
jgi:glutamyl-tRNA reductase